MLPKMKPNIKFSKRKQVLHVKVKWNSQKANKKQKNPKEYMYIYIFCFVFVFNKSQIQTQYSA